MLLKTARGLAAGSILILTALFARPFGAQEGLTRHLKTDDFEGVVFQAGPKMDWLFGGDYGRWTPLDSDIVEAEKICRVFLSRTDEPNAYYRQCLPKISGALKGYKRQYFGLLGKKGEKIVWINFFWAGEAPVFPRWEREPVVVLDGGLSFLNVKVDLQSKRCFDLKINGEA
jgi:hypothetical protein